MMSETQSRRSASPTGAALYHSGEEDIMTRYSISISEDGIWAGSGPRDQYGHIECSAILSAAMADNQESVYGPIEAAVTEAIEAEEQRAECVVNGYAYTMWIESEEHCECGALTGERCTWAGPTRETEIIEYMPEYLIQSHVAAGHRSIGAAGQYPHNGACRIRVEQSCAHHLLHAWQDGERTSEIDPWVRRVA